MLIDNLKSDKQLVSKVEQTLTKQKRSGEQFLARADLGNKKNFWLFFSEKNKNKITMDAGDIKIFP